MGYVYTETEGYDICWTMPHCVLSLKLIGLTFDCYDGERARRLGEGVLSKDQRKSFLTDNPSLLEMLSHRFYLHLRLPTTNTNAFILILYLSASSLEDTLSDPKSHLSATGTGSPHSSNSQIGVLTPGQRGWGSGPNYPPIQRDSPEVAIKSNLRLFSGSL